MENVKYTDIVETLRYMRCPPNENGEMRSLAEKYAQKVESVAVASFVYKAFDRDDVDDVLVGKDVKKHVDRCQTILLFAATIGAKVDLLIRNEAALASYGAIAADAAASACIEGFCRDCDRELARIFKGKFLTWRYSPGYGDMPLETQRLILKKLDAEKRLGLTLTSSGMMLPLKSVSAVIGVSDLPLGDRKAGCAVCALKDNCQFRKKGESCGL